MPRNPNLSTPQQVEVAFDELSLSRDRPSLVRNSLGVLTTRPPWFLSISHSESHFGIALSHTPVGLDLLDERRIPSAHFVRNRIAHPLELASVGALSPMQSALLFCVKEACVKIHSLRFEKPVLLTQIHARPEQHSSHWIGEVEGTLYHVDLLFKDHHIIAVAVQNGSFSIKNGPIF